MGALAGWENFYVIVGSSAGALVGLQFVVITLIADRPTVHTDSERASGAFATPTVIHFVSVLLLAALMSAPWQQIDGPAAMCGVVGIAGFFYSFVVARRMRSQTAYKPVLEDWMFHFVLPIAAYATLIVSFFGIRVSASPGLFAVAGASLLLLFVGIHNAWDAVTYYVFVHRAKHK
jgi:hypothetical protein